MIARIVSTCLLICLAALLVWPAVSTAVESLGAEPTAPLRISSTHWLHTGLIALVAMAVSAVLGGAMAEGWGWDFGRPMAPGEP